MNRIARRAPGALAALAAAILSGCLWFPPPVQDQRSFNGTAEANRTGSGSSPSATQSPSPASPAKDLSALPSSEIVVLNQDEGIRVRVLAAERKVISRLSVHRVVMIRTEGGLEAAEVIVNLGKNGNLVNAKGQTKKHDGKTISHLAKTDIMREEVLRKPGDPSTRRALFALPDVAVGDTIEYWYDVDFDTPVLFWTFELVPKVPVLRASFWVATDNGFQVETRASPGLSPSYSSDPGTVVRRVDGGPFLPPDVEPLAPDAAAAPAWFTFSILGADVGRQRVPLLESWGRVLRSVREEQRKEMGTASSLPPHGGPPDAVRVLYEWSRDRLFDAPALAGGDFRLALQIERERRVTERERVLYLKELLTLARVESRLALVRDRRQGALEVGFVNPGGIDGSLLRVRSSDGWVLLDPNCRGCAAGEVSWYFQNTDALVEDGRFGVEVVPIPVQATLAARRRVRATIALLETGDADVDLSLSLDGLTALTLRDTVREGGGTDAARRQAVAELISDLCPRASLRELTTTGLDTLRGPVEIRASVHVAALAVRAGGSLLVPLSPFSRLAADPLAAPARRDAVDLPFARSIDDATTIVVPKGYTLVDAPAALSTKALGGRVDSTAAVLSAGSLRSTLRVALPRVALPAARVGLLRPLFASYLNASNALAIVSRDQPAKK